MQIDVSVVCAWCGVHIKTVTHEASDIHIEIMERDGEVKSHSICVNCVAKEEEKYNG